MQLELDRVRVEFERITAVDGMALGAAALADFCSTRPAMRPGPWLPGEVGCLLSHLKAWRRIAGGEERWGAVFEDDLRVSPDLAALLRTGEWIPAEADIVRLEANRSMRLANRREIRDVPGRYLYRAVSGTTGAGAYIVSRSAAQWLLSVPPEQHSSVDIFLFKPKISRVAKTLRRYQVVPAVCIQDGLAEGREVQFRSLIRKRATFGRGYRKQPHMLLRLWPIRRLPVQFRS
jgi:glycosyl transferase family 25